MLNLVSCVNFLLVGPFVKYLVNIFLGYDNVSRDEVEIVVLFFDENNTGDLNFAEFLSCVHCLLKARLSPIKWNTSRSELNSSASAVNYILGNGYFHSYLFRIILLNLHPVCRHVWPGWDSIISTIF
jgi:hypothetical protein